MSEHDHTVVLLERLRHAQAVAQIGSWELDPAARTMWGSEEAFRIYGLPLSPDQLLPLPVAQAIPLPEYRPLLDAALADLFAGRRPYDIEFAIRRHHDGAIRYIHSLAEVVPADGRRGPVVVGTLHDITTRKHMEASLLQSEARTRVILEHAPDAILIGEAGAIVDLNNRAVDLTGYARDELVQMSIMDLFSPDELGRAPLQFERVGAGERVVAERMLTRKDGRQVPVEMHTGLMPDGRYHSSLRDISERRRLEQQLQLRQRMDSIGTLASGIAHDFNNILAAILGYTELLVEQVADLPPASQTAVIQIRAASTRAAGLMRRLQTLTRPDPQTLLAFDLHRVASDVFQVLHETTDRRIRKVCTIQPDRWFVKGCDTDLYHALMNLGLNAVQAIDERGVRAEDLIQIQVGTHLAGEGDRLGLRPGAYLHIAFSDTGPGMDVRVKAQAFDPLFTTKSKGTRKGQGLGLTMVFNIIVTQHGGAITIDTELGQGTTFHLYVPQGERPTPVEDSAASHPVTPGVVLVVEDEESIANLACRVLRGAGHRVILACDGEMALERYRDARDSVDVVLLDHSLPKLSGPDVLRGIAQLGGHPAIILSSGNALPRDAGLGASVTLLPKPYSLAALLSAVSESLRAVRAVSPVS